MPTKTTYKTESPFPSDWRGRFCKDQVSGFEGVCTARYDYINGCIRIEISGTDKDGKPEGFVFDQQQVQWGDKWLEGFEPAVKPAATQKSVGGPPRSRPVPR